MPKGHASITDTEWTPRMAVFDLDDTLYLERGFVVSGFDAVAHRLKELGFECPAAASVFLELIDRDGSGSVFDDGLAHFGIEPTASLISELVHTYRHHTPTIRPLAGIPALLDALRASEIRLGVITDGAVDIQTGKLRALDLLDRFEVVLPTDALGPDRVGWKPSALPFQTIEARSRLAGEALVYIGDNASKDFVGALACGWRGIRLRLPGQLRQAQPTPPGVTEVTTISALHAALGLAAQPQERETSRVRIAT